MEKMMGDKMVIKIKIPKLSSVATTDGEKTPEQDVIGILSSKTPEAKKVCLECKKEFSSGKALGGHMRVHVQSAHHKNPNFQKPPKTTKIHNNGGPKPYYLNSVNEEGKPTCSQCGKTFPSMKSLFGHMRCHPERVWRGILPPPDIPTSAALRRSRILNNNSSTLSAGCSSTSSENDLSVGDQERDKIDGEDGDQVVDLTKFIRGWTVTERRGRGALRPPANEDDEDLLGAVEDLMSLANGNGVGSLTESVITQQQRQLKLERSNGKAVTEEEGSPPAKFEVINDEYRNTGKRKKIKLMMELEPNGNDVVVQTPVTEQQQGDECKYKCTTCNKCFASHQALGGHRSSHNKPRLVTTAERHPSEELLADHHRSLILNILSLGESSEKEAHVFGGFNFNFNSSGVHQCKICDKIFATGQALGGHQRCHWSGGINVAVQAQSMSQITSAGEGGSQTGSDRKVLDFDLNEIPMMEEEEGGSGSGNIGNGNGYASSSYNSNMC